MKDSVYFRHDYDAQTDPKIIKLRVKFWWEGYGLFWATLEAMRGETDVELKDADADSYAYRFNYDTVKYKSFLNYCIHIELLQYNKVDKVIFSKRLQEDVEHMRNKSKKAKQSADTRWKAREDANAVRPKSKGNAIYKGKDIKDKKIKKRKVKLREEMGLIYINHPHLKIQNVKITQDEYNDLVKDYGELSIKQVVRNLSLWIMQEWDKYKNHYATLLKWIAKDNLHKIPEKKAAETPVDGKVELTEEEKEIIKANYEIIRNNVLSKKQIPNGNDTTN